jgi:hypothetical protein
MKRLDKFSILIENEEMGREVKRIADKAGVNVKNYDFSYNLQSGHHRNLSTYFFEKGLFCITPKIELFDTYQLITFDQFKEMFEGEIVGYECPMDLWGQHVRKGEVFILVDTNSLYYYPTKLRKDWACIPREIVETWKPVFKQTSKTVMVGGKEWKVSTDKDYPITSEDGAKISFDALYFSNWTIEKLFELFNGTATLSEIKQLVDTWNEIKNKKLNK